MKRIQDGHICKSSTRDLISMIELRRNKLHPVRLVQGPSEDISENVQIYMLLLSDSTHIPGQCLLIWQYDVPLRLQSGDVLRREHSLFEKRAFVSSSQARAVGTGDQAIFPPSFGRAIGVTSKLEVGSSSTSRLPLLRCRHGPHNLDHLERKRAHRRPDVRGCIRSIRRFSVQPASFE